MIYQIATDVAGEASDQPKLVACARLARNVDLIVIWAPDLDEQMIRLCRATPKVGWIEVARAPVYAVRPYLPTVYRDDKPGLFDR